MIGPGPAATGSTGLADHTGGSIRFVGSAIRQFILHGGIEIATTFAYTPSGGSERVYSFRTIVQVDADIINFVPDPSLFQTDPTWNSAFAAAYGRHEAGMRALALRMDRLRRTINMLSAGTGTIIAGTLWWVNVFNVSSKRWWIWFLLCPLVAYLFRRYAIPSLVRLAVRSGMHL